MYPIGAKLIHRQRGACLFSEACARLQETNPDPTSIFVELDGDIVEVTAQLVDTASRFAADEARSICVPLCGATTDSFERYGFLSQFEEFATGRVRGPFEWRFQGALGFGGKLYCDRTHFYVSCYSEDRTAERDAAIARANDRLAQITVFG